MRRLQARATARRGGTLPLELLARVALNCDLSEILLLTQTLVIHDLIEALLHGTTSKNLVEERVDVEVGNVLAQTGEDRLFDNIGFADENAWTLYSSEFHLS